MSELSHRSLSKQDDDTLLKMTTDEYDLSDEMISPNESYMEEVDKWAASAEFELAENYSTRKDHHQQLVVLVQQHRA